MGLIQLKQQVGVFVFVFKEWAIVYISPILCLCKEKSISVAFVLSAVALQRRVERFLIGAF